MGQRRRDKKQRKLTQQTTAAIYATAGANQAAQTHQIAMQQEQLRIAQVAAAEAQAEAARLRSAESAIASTGGKKGWHPDPLGRHQHRYWDGHTWTENVSDRGVKGVDPIRRVEQAAAPSASIEAGAEPLAIESTTGAPQASIGAPTVAQQIKELAELRDAGLLTEDEFASQKAKLLSS